MIIHWYVGFIGDHEGRGRHWFDLFTDKDFRHVLAIGYDPMNKVWVYYDPTLLATIIDVYHPDNEALNGLISFVSRNGRWLKVKPKIKVCSFGRWRHYCVPAIKHLLGSSSSALTPRGLYRDLIREGAQPAFEV